MRIDVLSETSAQMIFPERLLLYALIYGLRPTTVLEIGSAEGGSAMIICAAMDVYGSGRLVCVDPNPRFPPELLSRIAHRTAVLKGFSTDPAILAQAQKEAGSPFDLIFIDGDHSYLGALRDVEIASPLLRSGGYLLFHDAHYEEVKKAIDEALKHFSFLDCGLLSVDESPIKNEQSGKTEIWGGLRLLRSCPFPAPPEETSSLSDEIQKTPPEITRFVANACEWVRRRPGWHGKMVREVLRFVVPFLLKMDRALFQKGSGGN